LDIDIFFRQKVPGCLESINFIQNEVLRGLRENCGRIADDILFEMRIIINELMINAVKYGCEQEYDKHVEVMAGVYLDELAVITFEDEGAGFDYKSILQKELNQLNQCCICDLDENGRGMLIVSRLCDRIRFNRKGNKVTILKKINR